ncbi:MAG: oligosaccharide flippase family protein [Deltaproteobacteria bacterium]|nr:oligosaccharide flippase family protein [Deltaproteobacteria bacterium]
MSDDQSNDSGKGDASFAAEHSGGLGKRTARGILWTAFSGLLGRGAGFASTAVLTYLMGQEQYGLATTALAVVFSVPTLFSIQLRPELVRRRQRFADAAMLNLIYGSLLLLIPTTLCLVYIDPLLAWFNASDAKSYLQLALLLPLIDRLLHTGHVLLSRNLRFGVIGSLELASTASHITTALSMAYAGFGGLAVVCGRMARVVVSGVGANIASGLKWLKSPPLADGALIRELLAFGVPLTVVFLVESFTAQGDNLFVAKMFGSQALGVYAVAYTVAYTPVNTVTERIGSGLFSAVARFADDVPRRHSALHRSLSAGALMIIPVAAGIALCGPALVHVVFPNRWSDELAAVISGLGLMGAGIVVHDLADQYLLAVGRPLALLISRSLRLALLAAALLLLGRSSLVRCAWSVSAAFIAGGAVSLLMLAAFDRLALGRLIAQIMPALLGTALMAAAVLGLRRLVVFAQPWQSLLVEATCGALIYGLYAFVFHRQRLLDILNTLRGKSS